MRRQTIRLPPTDFDALNAKLDAIARQFGKAWLLAPGTNPLQLLWKRRDALATNELLNFGDAIEAFETTDATWVRQQVQQIKNQDEHNRAGAVFEFLGLNLFKCSGNIVHPTSANNPGYDGVVDLPNDSSLVISIKNFGMSSHQQRFQRHARTLDSTIQQWLTHNAASGTEFRVVCDEYLDDGDWHAVTRDVINILDAQLTRTSTRLNTQGPWNIIFRDLTGEYPLSTRHISSVVFVCCKAHQNEQDNFLEHVRAGCSNLVKHTARLPESACRVLLVRLSLNASIVNCAEWARDYFLKLPNEQVGVVILYQAAVVKQDQNYVIAHYIKPILGPQFATWSQPAGRFGRTLPNVGALVGVALPDAGRKILLRDGQEIPLYDNYVYQRGDIFRYYYRAEDQALLVELSYPAPGIRIHAEIENETGSAVLQMISSEMGELMLLP
jgi:hypothetical protein